MNETMRRFLSRGIGVDGSGRELTVADLLLASALDVALLLLCLRLARVAWRKGEPGCTRVAEMKAELVKDKP